MILNPGVYENLISQQLADDIRMTKSQRLVCQTERIDSAELPSMLAQYLAQTIQQRLDDDDVSAEEKMTYVNGLLQAAGAPAETQLIPQETLLSAVMRPDRATATANGAATVRPLSGFRTSCLFTGGQAGIPLGEEIIRDIATADHICIIVSFLKLSGIRMMMDALRHFCQEEGHTLRVITTTYCGVTEAKAVEQLSHLPRTQIRISYNTQVERLHAKSYIFLRESGMDTAYIGSSNLSRSAQTDGLEWNIRVTAVENPHIIKSAQATFERYWESPSFEDFRLGGIEKFRNETRQQQPNIVMMPQHFCLLPHQKQILDRLRAEREVNGIRQNLVVAATGTGKTVISAFDYQAFCRQHPERSRLLFVAHREEILRQSIRTYRNVLSDYNFGDLWVGSQQATHMEHLFISIQTFNARLSQFSSFGRDYYDYIVVDEAHHIAADSYRTLMRTFHPQVLLGLTATPERMDGNSLLPDFGGKISAEIRLPQALDEGLLTPFQYLCITDDVDLTDDELWQGGRYITSKLSAKLCTDQRMRLIIDKLRQYVPDEHRCRALCFCTDQEHARRTADALQQAGLHAAALTAQTAESERLKLGRDLGQGKINYLCVVDIFNEGVDIPEVDTALFLRPTESLTIFLQQLGRGLRLSPGKDYLTVLDFVGRANRNYDFASRFRALLTRTDRSVREQVEKGFTLLPHGCSIYMEEVAKEHILQNINGAIYNLRKLTQELVGYGTSVPTLSEFFQNNGQDARLIYRGKGNCWTSLKRAAGLCEYEDDDITRRLSRGIGSLIHINDVHYIDFIRQLLGQKCVLKDPNELEQRYALMLYYALFQDRPLRTGLGDVATALSLVARYPLFVQEINELLDYITAQIDCTTQPVHPDYPGLQLYGCYTRQEVFILFGLQTAEKTMQGSAAGAFRIDDLNTELFFVTLNKSDRDFSASTQYNDYFISDRRFHWQSRNTDSHERSGRSYVMQQQSGRRFLLFVRQCKRDGFGNTCPFHCLGLIDYVSSHGDFPMNIEWKMQSPALPRFIKAV